LLNVLKLNVVPFVLLRHRNILRLSLRSLFWFL